MTEVHPVTGSRALSMGTWSDSMWKRRFEKTGST